jgi:membrane-associated phospholipid phosphatase
MTAQKIHELLGDSQKLYKHLLKVILGSSLLSVLSMILLDQNLATFFNQPEIYSSWYQPARKLTDLGLFEIYFFFAICCWFFCRWLAPKLNAFKQSQNKILFFRAWSLNFMLALLVSGLFTHLVKFIVGRQRPHKSPVFDPFTFSPLTTHWHWHSFSSGHTQVMFTFATMFTLAFPKYQGFWIGFAVLIAFTRVMVADHFLSDTIFGACIGYCGTLLALHLMSQKTKNGLRNFT